MRGTVRRLLMDKGFGFISPESGPPDYFFHRSSVDTTAKIFDFYKEGEKVEFEEDDPNAKGPRAKNVRPVE